MSDGYLSDDKEMRLREQAGAECRECRHYWARDSWILDAIQEGCGAVDTDAPNGELVSGLMLRLARLTACPTRQPFEVS